MLQKKGRTPPKYGADPSTYHKQAADELSLCCGSLSWLGWFLYQLAFDAKFGHLWLIKVEASAEPLVDLAGSVSECVHVLIEPKQRFEKDEKFWVSTRPGVFSIADGRFQISYVFDFHRIFSLPECNCSQCRERHDGKGEKDQANLGDMDVIEVNFF